MAQGRGAEEIEELLAQYRASGLKQIEYCRQTGMVLSSLGRYLRRHSRAAQQLVRVRMQSSAEPATSFALVLGNGRRIESSWQFGDAELARVIRVAETV